MWTGPNLFTGVHDHVFVCFEGSKQVYHSHLLCHCSDALFEGSCGNHINKMSTVIVSKYQSLMMVLLKLKMLTLCKYMSMSSIPIQYQTRNTKSPRSSLSLVKICCLCRHEWDQAWMHGKEGVGLVADCAYILLVHKQQLGGQAQTASAWSAPSATCALVAPANMTSGWTSS